MKPIHLRCQDGGSNKFYSLCELPNGKWIVGYGPCTSGSTGQWSVRDAREAGSKKREKTGKGYKPCPASEIPVQALDHMLEMVRLQASDPGAAFSSDQEEILLSGQTGSRPTAKPKNLGPKRPKSDRRIDVWL